MQRFTSDEICIEKNFAISRQNIKSFNDFDIRADYNLGARDVLFARYSYGNEWETTTSRLPKLPAGFGSGDQANYPRSVAIGETHTFGQTIVNEFRFGWIRTKFGSPRHSIMFPSPRSWDSRTPTHLPSSAVAC